MCQLTYCNLKDPKLNKLMVYLLTTKGSVKNDDGTGIICSDNSAWKTKLPAEKITNYGEILSQEIVDDSPIPAHVRLATFGIPVEDKNAHPFNGNRFLLMHNGTLQRKNPNSARNGSDSEEFLGELENCVNEDKNADFPSLFNKAIDKFYGKFAFIIRDKKDSKDYVVRGSTANLYISYLNLKGKKQKVSKPVGYIVNTSDTLIKECIIEFINLVNLMYPELDKIIEVTEPKLIEGETISLAEEFDIKKMGDTKETSKPVESVKPTASHSYITRADRNSANSTSYKEMSTMARKIYEFLSSHSLNERDFQRIVFAVSGISLLELTEKDAQEFIKSVIPVISASKNHKNRIKKALSGRTFPDSAYKDLNLEYPWMLALEGKNKEKKLDQIVSYLQSR